MKKAVIVLGVGRDGTSLVAGILSKIGFFFGEEDDLIAPNEINPLGFWEHKALPEFNRRIMAENDVGEYSSTSDLIESFSYHAELDEFVSSTYGQKWKIGLKDPRFCVTLPAWMPSLVLYRRTPVIVSVYRDIETHVKSVTHNGKKHSIEQGTAWIESRRILQKALEERYGAIKVTYEGFLTNPHESIADLANSLEVKVSAKKLNEITEMIDPSFGR